MQTSGTELPLSAAESEGSPLLNILIAYQDVECSHRSMSAYESLVTNLGSEYTLSHTTWKFDLFQFPKMRELAAKDAIEADIILLCAREEDEIPEEVSKWIDQWSAQKSNQPSAIVAIFEESETGDSVLNPLRGRLEEVARNLGMAFFSDTLRARDTEIEALRLLTSRL